MTIDLVSIIKKNRIIPVAQFDDETSALAMAELLLKHSIHILEITLRTDTAFNNIRSVVKRFPDITLGAGSVLTLENFKMAADAGVSFCVAPGTDMEIVDYAAANGPAFIPGVSTPTELTAALKKCTVIKVFPIAQLGGIEYIKALSAPFKTKDFFLVPTGGVNQNNYIDYLMHERVLAVGMSHIVDSNLIKKGNFAALETRIQKVISGLP